MNTIINPLGIFTVSDEALLTFMHDCLATLSTEEWFIITYETEPFNISYTH